VSDMQKAIDAKWAEITAQSELANTVREGMIMCDTAWHEANVLLKWLKGHNSQNAVLIEHLTITLLNLGEQSDNYGQWLSKKEAAIARAMEALEGNHG